MQQLAFVFCTFIIFYHSRSVAAHDRQIKCGYHTYDSINQVNLSETTMDTQTLTVLKGFHRPWTALSNVAKLRYLFCGFILLSTIGVRAELNLPIGL